MLRGPEGLLILAIPVLSSYNGRVAGAIYGWLLDSNCSVPCIYAVTVGIKGAGSKATGPQAAILWKLTRRP